MYEQSCGSSEFESVILLLTSKKKSRQAIKGVLTGKALVIHTNETNPITLAEEVKSRSTQDNTKTPPIESQRNDSATLVTDQDSKVETSSTHQDHPESPQHEPERDNTKKRGSRLPKAGPAKRRKSILEDLYSGKLSNVVAFKNSNLVTRKR